jgi:hypothetical protein
VDVVERLRDGSRHPSDRAAKNLAQDSPASGTRPGLAGLEVTADRFEGGALDGL